MLSTLNLFLSLAIADPPKLCGDDSQLLVDDDIYKMALLGNTRPLHLTNDATARRIGPSKGVTKALLQSISSKNPDCVAFVGDMVRSGSKKEWKAFQEDQLSLIEGVPILPVVGDMEAQRDGKYSNLISIFPNIGNDIGYNRVGTWYSYDLESKGVKWRFMVLDSNKSVLKSRWQEQLAWIDEAVQGDYEGLFLFVHQPWYDLAGAEPKMNIDNTPKELIEYVEDSLGMMKLRAVFFGGGHANQSILPNGKYGTLHVGVGGGGAPAEDLYLWHHGSAAGVMDNIKLEEVFKESLLFQVDRWHSQSPISELAMDKAFNTGSYKDFPGLIDSTEFPVQGWWELKIKGSQSVLLYHHYLQNGSIDKRYKIEYTDKNGWMGTKL